MLFTILFLWQIPHSLAIAYIYREDYANAGFRLLPVIHPDGTSTCRQIVVNCVALLGIGLLPTLYNLAGSVYFFTALLAGIGFLAVGIYLERTRLRESRALSLVCLSALSADGIYHDGVGQNLNRSL